MVDREDLCIESDKLTWVLYCDLICLNYDGNVLDASVIALSAALQNGKCYRYIVKKASWARLQPCGGNLSVRFVIKRL